MNSRDENRACSNRNTGIVLTALSALLSLAALPLGAATQNWIGGSGTWDSSTTANWSGGAVPVNGDTVILNQAGVSIGYTAANLSGTGIDQLYLNNVSGNTVFTLDNSDVLLVSRLVSIGGAGNTFFNLTGSAELRINGQNNFIVGGAGLAPAVANQTGGTLTNGIGSGALFTLNPNGTYNLSAGTINSNRSLTVSGGTWNQTGGTSTWPLGLTTINSGTFNLSGGTINQSGFVLGANAVANWTGGTISNPSAGGRLQLTGAGASWTQRGGTMTINVAGNSGVNTLTLVPSSTIRGYGTIQDARVGLSSPGTFDNSGRVIADGGTLDLSRFNADRINNTTDNAGANGWFAVGGGRLVLPTLTVASPASTVFWGESATDADGIPDLVNSVKLAFTGITTGGTVTGSLLAGDRADAHKNAPVNDPLDTGMYALIGAWDLAASGINFGSGSAALTFRYDDLWAAQAAADMARLESDLKLLKYNTGTSSWDVLTSGVTLDTGANLMTIAGVTGFSLYGVAMLPEPGTCALGALAAAALLVRRRRQ